MNIQSILKSRLFVILFLLCCLPTGHAASHVLPIDLWAQPRTAARLLAQPVFVNTLRQWRNSNGATVLIGYPGGEEGLLWANELRDWFVAMGVASRYIRMVPGAGVLTAAGQGLSVELIVDGEAL